METQGTWTDADKAYTELHDALERLTDAAEAALVAWPVFPQRSVHSGHRPDLQGHLPRLPATPLDGEQPMTQYELDIETVRRRMFGDRSVHHATDARAALRRIRERNTKLEAALNRAGDRLAQVQPAVTEPWAFDIIPKAEQEIAEVLR